MIGVRPFMADLFMPRWTAITSKLAVCNSILLAWAKRMHVSQPAMSAQLSRLRDLLGDPLLLPF